MSLYTRVSSFQRDDSKLAGGLPSTSGMQDPVAQRVCNAILQNLEYLTKKVQDIRVPDESLPRTDVTKRPANYRP